MRNLMQNGWVFRALLLLCIIFIPLSAFAQDASVDSKVDKILRTMSDYIGGMESFSFSTKEQHNVNFWSGDRETIKKEQSFVVKRPNQLAWSVTRNGAHFSGVYDGSQISYFSKEKMKYAQVEAPDNLDDALDFASANLKLPLPIADILYSSPYDSFALTGTKGEYLGIEKVHGKKCHHLSFSHPALEWEMWIETGDKPLLRKLSLFYTQVEGVPESTIFLNDWNASPKITADTFSFTAPEGFDKVKVKLYLTEIAAADSQK